MLCVVSGFRLQFSSQMKQTRMKLSLICCLLVPLMTEEVQAAFARSCQECHGADGHGITAVAPDLRISPKRSVAEWEKYLRNPKSVDSKTTKAAPRGLSDEEIAALAAYLADLTQHNPPPQK